MQKMITKGRMSSLIGHNLWHSVCNEVLRLIVSTTSTSWSSVYPGPNPPKTRAYLEERQSKISSACSLYNLLDSVCTMVGMATMCSTRTRKVRRRSRGEEIISDDGLSVNSTRNETIHKVTQQHY